jgi:hypothetical protein
VLTSINDRGFQASPAVGQPLLFICAAELSENGEIFNFDDDADNNDLLSVKQILASLKRATKVINLIYDDNNDNKSDDNNYIEVRYFKYTRTT